VTKRALTVDQTSQRLIRDTLREVLCRAVQVGPDAVDGISSVQCQACAVLYTLLHDHPIDRRGRCRSCRPSGAIIGLRRRPCRIYLRASYWMLRQPDETLLLSHLADELEADPVPRPGGGNPPDRSSLFRAASIDSSDTDVLSRIDTEPCDPPIPRHQTPAAPPPLPPYMLF
jgi:hypothetical protein